MTRHILRIGIAIMTTMLGLGVLWLLRDVVLYVLVSLALAGAISPLISNIGRRGRAARIGMALLYLLGLAAFLYFLLEVGGATVRDIQGLAEALSEQDVWQQPEWVRGTTVQEFLNDRLPPPSVLVDVIAGERGSRLLSILLGFTQGIIGIISGTLVILFLGLYWSANRTHFQQLWLSLLPPVARRNVRDTLRTVESDFERYIRAEFFQSVLIGVLLGLGYWALGSPYPTLLAVIGALANLVPIVGVMVAILTPLLIGLLSSLQLSLFSALLTALILLVVKVWLKPRLYLHRRQNPILTIFLLIPLADAFGLMGFIAAPPLAMTMQILWDVWVARRAKSGAVNQVVDLKERQKHLSAQIAALEDPPQLLTSGLERLNVLIEQAEPVLRDESKRG